MQTITKDSVLQSYHLFKDRNIDMVDSSILSVINHLGGVDNILEEFLHKDNNIHISQAQLNQLNQLFTNKHPTTTTVLSSSNGNEFEIYNKHDEMYHQFDISDTYFQDICSATLSQTALKIATAPWAHVLFALVFLLSLISRAILRTKNTLIAPLFALISGVVTLGYVMVWFLSANKQGVRLVLLTFEFWLKCGYGLLFVVSRFMNLHIFPVTETANVHRELQITSDIAMLSNLILIVFILSMFDALYINRVSKVLFSGSVALFFTLTLILQYFTIYVNGIDSVITVTDRIRLSLVSLQINAMEVLVLFFWRQTVLTLVNKERCVLIKYRPHIQWIDKRKTKDIGNITSPTNDNNDVLPTHDEVDDKQTVQRAFEVAIDHAHMTIEGQDNSEYEPSDTESSKYSN
eukprot:510202_1